MTTGRLEQLLLITSHASASEACLCYVRTRPLPGSKQRTTGALEKKSARVVVVFVGIPGTRLAVESHAYSRTLACKVV